VWYGRWIWILFTDAGPDWPRLKIKTWLQNIWSPGNSTANSGRTELHRTVAHDCTHRFGFRVSKENRMRGRTGHICPKMSNVHHGKQDWDSGIPQGLCVPPLTQRELIWFLHYMLQLILGDTFNEETWSGKYIRYAKTWQIYTFAFTQHVFLC